MATESHGTLSRSRYTPRMLLLWLLACASAGEEDSPGVEPCEPGTLPTLEIGTGERSFSSIEEEDGELELVRGPQGGVHAVIAFRARMLDDSAPVVTRIVTEANGEILADVTPYLSFRCVGPDGIQEAWGAIMVFSSSDLDVLDGRSVRITATVTDVAGTVAHATVEALLVNGEADAG